ncbi:MAG TPA: DUF3489 domain-containing protein [Terriglobales bacterium]|nr:DUF3489 domain-containing protein [Terriglobales bacterium]
MTTFTINEQNEIVAFATAEEASTGAQTPFHTFSSQQELADLAASWPTERLLAILNSLAGEKPVKKLKDPKAAVARIWARIQGLSDASKPEPEPAAKTKPAKKAKGRAQAAKGAPAKGKASKKTSAAKNAPKGKKSAKAAEAGAPREGSKTAQVVAMLQRKNGATITEIMDAMSWQRHTVRGFMAGAMKKAGFTVESFKPEGGERSYRLPK